MSAQLSATRPFFCSFDTKMIYVVQNMTKRRTSAWVAVRRGREDLRRTSGGGLTGMERVGRREGGETGGARLRPWALVEPRDHAVDIDGGSGRDVLQVRFDHAITMPS